MLLSVAIAVGHGQPVRELAQNEKEAVQGGLFFGGSSGGKGGGGSSSRYDDITLKNIPYYQQNDSTNSRSQYYCGLASAMMVRNMGYSYSSSAYCTTLSQLQVNEYMKAVDNALKSLRASFYFSRLESGDSINLAEHGLLYYDYLLDNASWNSASDRGKLFSKTWGVLNSLYTDATLSGLLPIQYYVGNISVRVAPTSSAEDQIWSHIKNKKQPVVVVMDSNRSDELILQHSINGMTASPTLHYEVIVGIKEDSSGKWFIVNDPWETYGPNRKYKASDFVKAMEVNSGVMPQWVYYYAKNNHGGAWNENGCYFILIND